MSTQPTPESAKFHVFEYGHGFESFPTKRAALGHITERINAESLELDKFELIRGYLILLKQSRKVEAE